MLWVTALHDLPLQGGTRAVLTNFSLMGEQRADYPRYVIGLDFGTESLSACNVEMAKK